MEKSKETPVLRSRKAEKLAYEENSDPLRLERNALFWSIRGQGSKVEKKPNVLQVELSNIPLDLVCSKKQ